MDNVEYKSCIVPKCKNNSEIAPNLTFFEVSTNTHKHTIDKWQEAIGISMDVNTVMYCCQDHFDLQDDTYDYVEYCKSGDANGENKIQLKLKHDAVPHRFECQYDMGHRIKPVSTDCNAIEGSSSDIDPLTTPPLEEMNGNNVNILGNSTTDSNVEEVLEPVKYTNGVKDLEIPTITAIESSSSDIEPLTCFIPSTPPLEGIKDNDVNNLNDSTKDSDVDEVLEPTNDPNEVKLPEILNTDAIVGSSSDMDPLTCFIPITPPLKEINYSDVNISNDSTKDSDVEEVLEPIKDSNEVEPEILTINTIEGSSFDIDPLSCFIPSMPPLKEINHSDVNISKDSNEVKEPEILTINTIEGSSSDIDPLTCFIPSTPPLEEINLNDENISNDSTKDSDVEDVLEPIKDTNEVNESKVRTTNAVEGSSSDINPLTSFIPSTPPLEKINHSDVNISNDSAKVSNVEEVLEPIKDPNEVKEPEILTINPIVGSSSDIDPLTCFIPSTPPLKEINHSDINISNDFTKDSDVEEELEPIKDTNKVKEPELLITNANSQFRIIDNKIVNNARLLNIYKMKRLMALCKPLKIQIEDLKNILVTKNDKKVRTLDCGLGVNSELTDKIINKSDPKYGMTLKRKPNEIADIVLKKKSRLITRIITWDREQSHCIAIHDLQCKEVDIYYMNSDLDITTYKRIIDVSTLSEKEQYIFKTEFKGRDDRLRVKQCCCWFNRENVIGESLANYVRKSLEFTKKQHPCKGSVCTCCCRNIPIINSYSTLPDMDKIISVWLKNIKARGSTRLGQGIKATRGTRVGHVLAPSVIVKAMTVTPKVEIDNIVRINDDSVSLNIKINSDCYQIDNGHLVLYTKYDDCPEFLNIPLVVNKNVCCWYARENVLNDLLKQKVSLSAVKFMKTTHLCPITPCKCCCKPKPKVKKTNLPNVYAITRHTTNASWKNMKISIVFSKVTSSSNITPLTKTKISQNNTPKIRILDNKILQDKTSVSNVSESNTRTLQNKTPGTDVLVSNTRTLQNETLISQFPASKTMILQKNVPLSNLIILQNNTNETGDSEINTFHISQSIEEPSLPASPDVSELDPTDTQESTSYTNVSEPISQPFVINTVQEPTSFLGAFMRTLNDPQNTTVESKMDNTPNNNLILTSVVSLAEVQSSDETVVLDEDLNTVTDVVVVPDSPDITNNLLPTYMTPEFKPNKERFQKCRAKNLEKCKSKQSITPTSSVSDLNKKTISVQYEDEESNQTIDFAQMAPTVGSIISMAELSDVSVPVLSDATQDNSQPSICTFIHIPKTTLRSAVANNLTSEAPSDPVPMQANLTSEAPFDYVPMQANLTSEAPFDYVPMQANLTFEAPSAPVPKRANLTFEAPSAPVPKRANLTFEAPSAPVPKRANLTFEAPSAPVPKRANLTFEAPSAPLPKRANLTFEAPSAPVPKQASSSKKSSKSRASTSRMPVTKATKNIDKKTLNMLISGSTKDTLRSSTVDILQKLNDIRFIHNPGHQLSAQLGTKLKNLSTTELQILNSVFIMVEHQIEAAGLVNRTISFKLNNLFDNIALPENETPKVQPTEMYTHLGSLASLKQTRDTESFNALLKKQSINPLLSKTTKRSVSFSMETTKVHNYVADSSSKKVKR